METGVNEDNLPLLTHKKKKNSNWQNKSKGLQPSWEWSKTMNYTCYFIYSFQSLMILAHHFSSYSFLVRLTTFQQLFVSAQRSVIWMLFRKIYKIINIIIIDDGRTSDIPYNLSIYKKISCIFFLVHLNI